jgi:hypothetical protein
MSTLWTPEGERPIRRDPPPSAEHPPGSGSPGGSGGPGEPDEEISEEEVREQMDQLREQLARTPAEMVIANHAFGLFELAALHLSLQPPQLEQARLAIDALAALVEGLGARLGEAAPQLTEGVSQLRLAYVQIHRAVETGAGAGGDTGLGGDSGAGESPVDAPAANAGEDSGAGEHSVEE